MTDDAERTPKGEPVPGQRIRRDLALWAAAALVSAAAMTAAAAPTAAQNVALGKQIWLNKVNCRDCHGWGAHGVQDDPQAPRGSNLRSSILGSEDLAMTIRCGRPGTEMPYFNRFSYTDDRCFGLTAEEIGDQKPPPGVAHLSNREVNAVIDLILDFRQRGETPTFDECKEFWGEEATLCDRYR